MQRMILHTVPNVTLWHTQTNNILLTFTLPSLQYMHSNRKGTCEHSRSHAYMRVEIEL